MTSARTTPGIRIRRARVTGLLVAVAVIAAALAQQWPASSSTTAASPGDVPRDVVRRRGGLDPALAAALRRAAADAAADGVALRVTSGRRSPERQRQLLDEAIAKYGSREEAARWVATPETSPHVSGDAVDVASSGAAWLAAHGAAHGLCRIYDNEPWHFEWRPGAAADGCPPTYADPTTDPRMHE